MDISLAVICLIQQYRVFSWRNLDVQSTKAADGLSWQRPLRFLSPMNAAVSSVPPALRLCTRPV
ncbi:hypothetical protein JZ751_028056 [Albula glossodonta]|uniref:Uncharacterized protein n=1 Tax=Albula glossodonta TaxID=121402 RepID=A0A8T2PJC8_9TELE|nr:hypothetical protein JZ751_028056 [Albula glossodonta]